MITPELLLLMVESAPVLAFDTETTGLTRADTLVGLSIADPGYAGYLPIAHTGGGNSIDDVAGYLAALRRAFATRARRGFTTVFHNAQFDLVKLGQAGVMVGGVIEDTGINAVLINNGERDYSLDACCQRADVPGKADEEIYHHLAQRIGLKTEKLTKGQLRKRTMGHFHTLRGDGRLAQVYGTDDTVATLALYQSQLPKLVQPDPDGYTLEAVWKVERALIRHLAVMELVGMRVDVDYAQRVKAQLAARVEEHRARYFPDSLNLNSSKQIHAWMSQQGCPSPYLTESDTPAPSYNKFALAKLGEPGSHILAFRRLDKALSYVSGLIDKHIVGDRVYPKTRQIAAATPEGGTVGVLYGRTAVADPPMQQVSKRDREIAGLIRPIFVADEGMELYEGDFSQQEPRWYADYANCKRLIDGYRSKPPIDIHTQAAEVLALDREQAKTMVLAFFNGGGAGLVVQHHPDIPYEVADERLWKIDAAFPEIGWFRKGAQMAAEARGYVRTKLGRRQFFPNGWMTHAAVSRIIQGTGADQLKDRLVAACDWVEACSAGNINILMNVHDSVVWQAEGGMGASELKAILERCDPPLACQVPHMVEIKKGPNWGQTSKFDPGNLHFDDEDTPEEIAA